MAEHLGILITEIGDDYIQATMPVDDRTRQPMGLLHGGASVVLAETLGSVAANLAVDPARFACVGLEINANHVRAVHRGQVTGNARPVHIGRSTQVWQIEIHDDENRLVCLSRITLSVLDRSS
ncbi:MAG: hotdog fold thioesterase [Gammaproteobacteria bacterium]|nr:hotdog fold thioesterase [Gammaproteobacteria bacterium]NNF59697.1 hotdog fold thioesterase [Gammaproteobacteria bacterium]